MGNGIIRGVILAVLQMGDQQICQLNLHDFLGQCAFPILTGHPFNFFLHTFVQVGVCVGELIGDGCAVFGGGIGFCVKLCLLPSIGQGSITEGIHAIFSRFRGETLGGEDIVRRIVSVGGNG